MIIWFTGQPNSGKSTLAKVLMEFYALQGKKCIHIDGDELRNILKNHDYSKSGRMFNVEVAQSIASTSDSIPNIQHVIVSMVSPYRSQRDTYKKTHNVVEIYLTSSRFREGRMVDDYEPPTHSYLHLDTDQPILNCLESIVMHMSPTYINATAKEFRRQFLSEKS